MSPLLVILVLYLVFFVYLMFAGAGLARTLGILGKAAQFGSIGGLVTGIVASLASVDAAVSTFLFTMMFVSLVCLPTFSVYRARDFILPSSSVLEVVCLNALVMVVGKPPRSYPFLDTFFQGGFHLLLNPFVLLMPKWLGFALSFWPAALALRLAAQGENATPRSRFFLNLWVQLLSVVWVLPAAIGALRKFDRNSLMDHFEVLVACLGLVYVVLTWVSLRTAMSGKQNPIVERWIDSNEPGGFAQSFANRMDPGRWPPLFYVFAGVGTYLVTWVALVSFLDLEMAATVGFVAVVIASSLAPRNERLPVHQEPTRGSAGLAWPISAALLVVLLTILQPMAQGVLVGKVRRASPLENEVRPYPDFGAVIDASARRCEFDDVTPYRLSCPQDARTLEAVPHPPFLEIPLAVFADKARDYELSFGARKLHCVEMLARVRGEDGSTADAVLLLVYDPLAVNTSQYAWVVDRDASCGRVVEVNPSRREGMRSGFGYLWHAEVAALRGEQIGWLAEFKNLGAKPQETDGAVAPSKPPNFVHTPHITTIAQSAPAACRLIAETLVLRCPQGDWLLTSVAHPANLELPLSVDLRDGRHVVMTFGARAVNCVELPARIEMEGRAAAAVMLLVFNLDAADAREFGWVVDVEASCARLAQAAASGDPAMFAYKWREKAANERGEDYGVIGSLNAVR